MSRMACIDFVDNKLTVSFKEGGSIEYSGCKVNAKYKDAIVSLINQGKLFPWEYEIKQELKIVPRETNKN